MHTTRSSGLALPFHPHRTPLISSQFHCKCNLSDSSSQCSNLQGRKVIPRGIDPRILEMSVPEIVRAKNYQLTSYVQEIAKENLTAENFQVAGSRIVRISAWPLLILTSAVIFLAAGIGIGAFKVIKEGDNDIEGNPKMPKA